eukprot:m.19330 g.19330  ORF g.19330 m.19330 type:complete len:370 (+) comp10350_c0_seq1:147-1256(+)
MAQRDANLVFAEDFTSAGYKLLELNPDTLRALEQQQEVVFKGEEDEDVVLCTSSRTFSVKVADTSNALYLCTAQTADQVLSFTAHAPRTIAGQCASFLELAPIAPRLDKLRRLLEQCPYSPEKAAEQPAALLEQLTWRSLTCSIQCSDDELQTALMQLNAFELDGRWRVLEKQYETCAFDTLLTAIAHQGWDLQTVPLLRLADRVQEHDVPLLIVRCLLQKYSSSLQPQAGDTVYTLDGQKVCQFRAIELLSIGQEWEYSDFMTAWKEACPQVDLEEFVPCEGYLKGLALVQDNGSAGRSVRSFPAWTLSEDPKTRFDALFTARAEWRHEDIIPYIRDITSPSMTEGKLLFKYARSFTASDGAKMYNKR